MFHLLFYNRAYAGFSVKRGHRNTGPTASASAKTNQRPALALWILRAIWWFRADIARTFPAFTPLTHNLIHRKSLLWTRKFWWEVILGPERKTTRARCSEFHSLVYNQIVEASGSGNR